MAVLARVLLVALALLAAAQRDPSGYQYNEYSFQKPYMGAFVCLCRVLMCASAHKIQTAGGMSVPNWDIIGNTVVSDEFIRLTPDRQSKRGAIWTNRVSAITLWSVIFHIFSPFFS